MVGYPFACWTVNHKHMRMRPTQAIEDPVTGVHTQVSGPASVKPTLRMRRVGGSVPGLVSGESASVSGHVMRSSNRSLPEDAWLLKLVGVGLNCRTPTTETSQNALDKIMCRDRGDPTRKVKRSSNRSLPEDARLLKLVGVGLNCRSLTTESNKITSRLETLPLHKEGGVFTGAPGCLAPRPPFRWFIPTLRRKTTN